MGYLEKADTEVADLIRAEQDRQSNTLEMIASENHVSPAVLEAMGTVLTDKYAEGYPAKRWYCGCEVADRVEQLAIDRAKQLFGADHANVQPHSGTNANLAVYLACLKPGQKIMGMRLDQGGHLSHGLEINLSGMVYKAVYYGVRQDTETLDMDQVRQLALAERPDLIIAGASAYPRTIDFEAFGAIADEVGCPLMSDIAHIAGLVAGGVHPDPVPHSAFVTTTTHKTLRGPRGAIILCKKEYARAIDRAVFPGIQGGPLVHMMAAKAVALGEALKPEFRTYARNVIENAKILADSLAEKGWRIVSGGTDTHLLLIDLRPTLPDMTGRQAGDRLARVGIIVNKNAIPFDSRPPAEASGIRIGSPALTSRLMGPPQMRQIAGLIDKVLRSADQEQTIEEIRRQVADLCRRFPPPFQTKACC